MKSPALAAIAASIFVIPALAGGLYTKSSPVLQVDAKSYNKLIEQSNYTSIVEFYAPWCGHCQNLKPAYEKAAKNLKGLAKVAAVNCDDEANKPLCGRMGVQGFPTLKIVRPSKKPGRPTVEDYQGARSAKAIVDAVVDKIPNHVKRVTDKGLDEWLQENNSTAKAVLFSDKGTTSALLRALAIDFLGSIGFAQIRDKEKKAVELFGVKSYPTLILLPGGDKDGIVYDGEMKKEAMSAFFSQIASPNPDPAPAKAKTAKQSDPKAQKKSAKASSQFSSASESHKSAEASSAKTSAASETLQEPVVPSESPDPNVVTEDTAAPVKVQDLPSTIPTLETASSVRKACLETKSHTCILALLPAKDSADAPLSESAQNALASLGKIHHKHEALKTKLFPFYSLPATNEFASRLRKDLKLKPETDLEIIATNAKRSWWKHFQGDNYGQVAIEDWIDAIRMGEGKKEKLPDGLIQEASPDEPKAEEQQPIQIEIEELPDDDEPAKERDHDEL